MKFHTRESVLVLLAVGGFVELARNLGDWVDSMYIFAQTPRGLAALVVASVLLSGASLVTALIRKA